MDQEKKPKGSQLLDRPLESISIEGGLDPEDHGMVSLDLEVLTPDQPSPLDLFVPFSSQDGEHIQIKQICSQNEEFKSAWYTHFKQSGMSSLMIKASQAHFLESYLEKQAGALSQDPARRGAVLRELASINLRLFFGEKMSGEQLRDACQKSEKTVNQLLDDQEVLGSLAQVLRASFSVYAHSVNVCLLSLALVRYLGMDDLATLRAVGVGGLLHDVGLSRVPKNILRKTGDLSPEETVVVRKHPRWGHQMLSGQGAVPDIALQIVLHHHENADGSGYPSGLNANDIPFWARVVRLVDSYDAMTSRRSYRDAISAAEAAAILVDESRDKYGHELVSRFLQFMKDTYAD